MLNEKLISMLAACAVTVAGIAIAAPAVAKQPKTVVVTAPDADIPTRRVSYRDLNLVTLAGERTLNRRVGQAVRSVCFESVGTEAAFQLEFSCRKESWDGARPQIARAIQRARDIAQNGYSAIAPVAITIGSSGN